MKTKIVKLNNGILLIARDGYEVPTLDYNKFPTCCGARNGWQEKLVPDKPIGISFSPACHIHDDCFENGLPTWSDFHQSNGMLFRNLFAIIKAKGTIYNIVAARLLAINYFLAVDTLGAIYYEKIHGNLT